MYTAPQPYTNGRCWLAQATTLENKNNCICVVGKNNRYRSTYRCGLFCIARISSCAEAVLLQQSIATQCNTLYIFTPYKKVHHRVAAVYYWSEGKLCTDVNQYHEHPASFSGCYGLCANSFLHYSCTHRPLTSIVFMCVAISTYVCNRRV